MLSERTLPSVTDEAERVAAAARAAGVTLRVTGGVGVALTCDSASHDLLARHYSDIDVVGHAKERQAIVDLLSSMGYVPDEAFNAVHGARRLFFWDDANKRQFDVFLDKVEMCHVIDLRQRLRGPGPALTSADLLLMKLQIVESNEKDLRDIVCLLADLAANDWGLWRTVTMVAKRADAWATQLPGLASREHVHNQVCRFIKALEDIPKSRAWKLRARVGERKRWYALPEESH
jgi:hypothetical protein